MGERGEAGGVKDESQTNEVLMFEMDNQTVTKPSTEDLCNMELIQPDLLNRQNISKKHKGGIKPTQGHQAGAKGLEI